MSKKANLPRNIILRAGPAVYGGYALGRIPQDLAPGFETPALDIPSKVIFIKGTIPDEIVEISITEEKKDYFVGRIDRIVEPSPFRVKPRFGRCVGCHLEYISYERQVTIKEEVLADSLRRIGGIETSLAPPLTSQNNEWYYRYRAQFKVSQNKIGFHREKSNELIEIESSPLLLPEINKALGRARLALRRNPKLFSQVTELWITYGDGVFAFIKTRPKAGEARRHFDELGRLLLGYEFKGVLVEAAVMDADGANLADASARSRIHPAKTLLRYGEEFLVLKLDETIYTVSPNAFFQANWKVNQRLVGLIKAELSKAKGGFGHDWLSSKRVLDLFSGAGNFSLSLASSASDVIAVEENPVAIKDGERNLEINKIKNMRFVRSPAEDFDILTQLGEPVSSKRVGVVLLDPPRGGLTDKLINSLINARPERIVYVSCNPSTFARDLKKLTAKYRLESVRLVDFFPQTYHIEAVAFLGA